MQEIIVEYLNDELYYSTIDDCVFSISNDNCRIGYNQIEKIIVKIFDINEDIAHAILFNWLLFNGVKLVRKNWNKTYLVHNKNVTVNYESTTTENIDFEYKLI